MPVFVTLLAPLILLLTPLLLPVGFGLTVFGLGRAGLIAALGQLPESPHRRMRRSTADEISDSSSETPTRLQSTRTSPEASNGVIELKHGSFRELNQLAGKRAERLVKQVSSLVRDNLSKATKEVSGEVEQHLHALQRELQSWAGANPNLKPYCHGHIGWLLRLEVRQMESLGLEAQIYSRAPGGDAGAGGDDAAYAFVTPNGKGAGHAVGSDGGTKVSRSWSARRGCSVRQRPDLDMSLAFEDLLEVLPPANAPLTADVGHVVIEDTTRA